MADAIGEVVGALVEWLFSKLPRGCLIVGSVLLAVAIIVGVAWVATR